MPPAKTKPSHDDRSEHTSAKEKQSGGAHSGSGSRGGRRNGGNAMANGSSLKEVVSTNDIAALESFGDARAAQASSGSGMAWGNEERALLHEYRFAHRLDTPSSFKNPMSHIKLSSGVGLLSPTMARQRSKRRVSKDHLALAVRKNFNSSGVNENEVIVGLLYKARHQDKTFRVKVPAQKTSR